jgi:hypothetical protein
MSRLSSGTPINLDKRSKILLGVLAVVVVAAAAFFLLKGGSSSGDTATGPVTVPPKSGTAAAGVAPKATPAATPSPTPAITDNGSSTRDPFMPLAEEAAAPAARPSAAVASPSAVVSPSAARSAVVGP